MQTVLYMYFRTTLQGISEVHVHMHGRQSFTSLCFRVVAQNFCVTFPPFLDCNLVGKDSLFPVETGNYRTSHWHIVQALLSVELYYIYPRFEIITANYT